MADNQRIVIGVNLSKAKRQFEINPKLQRTRAGEPSVRQGFTLGTFIPNFPTVEENQVRLPNRARPLNPFFKQKIRVPRSDIIGRLDVPNPPALTKIAKSEHLDTLTRVGFIGRRS